MPIPRRAVFLLVLSTFVTATTSGARAGSHDERIDFKVLAGALHPGNPLAPYEYTRYYPELLRVHRGQTVSWEFLGTHRRFDQRLYGLHSVSFFPNGDRTPYRIMRADEWPTVAFNDVMVFGTGCGRNVQPACVIDDVGTYVDSGFPTFDGSPFRATIALPTGRYPYFCSIFPHMSGAIEVVPDSVSLKTQAEIDAEVLRQIADDSREVDRLVERLSAPSHETHEGVREWVVHAGAFTDDKHVEVQQFLPAHLPLRTGDRIRFVATEFVHTVSFPSSLVGGPDPIPNGLGGLGFMSVCDLDDRTSGAPGVPGSWGVRGPECPGNREVMYAPWVPRQVRAPNSALVSRATLHTSGIMASAEFPETHRPPSRTGIRWAPDFSAAFPVEGDFEYRCMVHPATMNGSISVR